MNSAAKLAHANRPPSAREVVPILTLLAVRLGGN
jgi:hypothetical protein